MRAYKGLEGFSGMNPKNEQIKRKKIIYNANTDTLYIKKKM